MREALRELGHELDEREVVRELQRYDRNGNGLLELAEFLQLAAELGRGQRSWSDSDIRAAFRRFDANNSGKLDYKELRTALRGLGVDVNEREAVRVLQSYDGDGNGLMDLDEFSRLVRQVHIRGRRGSSSKWTDADVRRAFHKYDSNSSGKLDYKELRGALQDLGLRHETDEAVRVLQQFDRSGDGLLSLDEFGKLVRQLSDSSGVSLSPHSGVDDWNDGEIRAAFLRYDTNRSGKLDYKELRGALRDLGVRSDEREAVRTLQEYDRNGNGLLELSGFTTLVRKLDASGQEAAPRPSGGGSSSIGGWFGFGSSSKWTDADVRRAFHKYDGNSSGKLDYKELRAALQDLGLRHDTDEAVRVLREFDRAGDGLLSLDEFGKLVRQLADGAASALPLPSELPPALPPGWVETTEPGSLRVYYYNRETRQAQWHRPGTATPLQP